MALVVFTGGARSGKSSAAQRLAARRSAESGAPVVVAVFGSGDGDPEMAARIERHRSDRPDAFTTIEAASALSWRAEVPSGSILLLDCLGTLAGLAMGAATDAGDAPIAPDHLDEILATVTAWLSERDGDTIVVTNEVGSGVVPAYASGRAFRDALGRANAALIGRADAAYLALAGRLLDLTESPTDTDWPAPRKDPRP